MSGTKGRKDDSGKPRFGLIDPFVLLECAKVAAYGAVRYGDHNWRRVTKWRNRYMDAGKRHDNAYERGEWLDPESGLPHLAHSIMSRVILLARELRNRRAQRKREDARAAPVADTMAEDGIGSNGAGPLREGTDPARNPQGPSAEGARAVESL